MDAILATVGLDPIDGIMIPICAVIFAVFISAVWRALFLPLFQLAEAREAATSGAAQTATDALRKAEQLRKEHDRLINEARVKAVGLKLEKLTATRSQATALTQSAERAAAESLSKARAEMARTHDQLRRECATRADQLAEEIVKKILTPTGAVRRTVSVSGTQIQ